MTDIALAKSANGALVPIDQQGIEHIAKMKLDGAVTASIKKLNNPKFHAKLFTLFNLGFDAWEPAELEYKGEKVCKEFNQFRKDITILAGYYDTAINFKGEIRLSAKSLNFNSMDHDEREALYNAVINVILSRILTRYTRHDLDNVINQVLGFA